MSDTGYLSNKKLAPVVIPTLCRFEHFKNCVESLSRCILAEDTDLYVGLDYPTKESHWDGYNKIRNYLASEIRGFKTVNVFEHEKNLGAIDNSRFLYNEVSKNHDCYIFTEDDNVFSPNFLSFMNNGLEKYHDDDSVYAICGYCYPLNECRDNGYFLYSAYSAWGVGEWIRKAKTTQSSKIMINYVDSVLASLAMTFKLYKDSPATLDGLISMRSRGHYYGDNILEAWLVENNIKCVFPAISKVKNMGHDGSGIHCENSADDIYAEQTIDKSKDTSFVILPSEEYHKMENQMYKFKARSIIIKMKIMIKYILFRLNLL